MASKYKTKQAKPITKQTSPLPFRQKRIHVDQEMCSNCGRERSASLSASKKVGGHRISGHYSKCHCGGTFQKFSVPKAV